MCNLPHKWAERHKPCMIISFDAEKIFGKIQYCFIIKVLDILEIQWTYFNITKVISRKSTSSINLNGGKLKALLKIGTRQGCPLSLYLFKIVLQVLAGAITKLKEIKGHKHKEGRSQTIAR